MLFLYVTIITLCYDNRVESNLIQSQSFMFLRLFMAIYLHVVFWHMYALEFPLPIHANRAYLKWHTERNNKMCQSVRGGRSSYLSSQPPQMLSLSLLLPLSLNDSDIQIFAQECSDSWCVCVRACMRVCISYDKKPAWNRSLLLRLVDFSLGSWVHLLEQNCYLQMWPLQLKNY